MTEADLNRALPKGYAATVSGNLLTVTDGRRFVDVGLDASELRLAVEDIRVRVLAPAVVALRGAPQR